MMLIMEGVLKELVKAEANHDSFLRRIFLQKGQRGEMIIKENGNKEKRISYL
jgi:hypothetical protein